MSRERIAEKLFDIVFVTWCFCDIILRTAFEQKINSALRAIFLDNNIDIDSFVDISVLFLLLTLIVFFQRYSYVEMVVIIAATLPIVIGTLNSGNNNLISLMLFVVAARHANLDKIIRMYFFILVITIPFIIIMCLMGVLPDYTVYRGGLVRHAFGFEHPNRLGMRIFQLVACFCYITKDNVHKFVKYVILCTAAYYVYRVPNSQTAYISIIILMLLSMARHFMDKNEFRKKRFTRIMVIMAAMANFGTVIISCFDPYSNKYYHLLDKILSRRFTYGYRMYKYYGITLWGQHVDTLVKDSKYVGVYRQWYLDNAYFSILLRFGIVVYFVFSFLFIWAIIYYAQKGNYSMVAILFTYAIYGIMTTGFYMMSHNIFLLAISSPLYSKNVLENNSFINKRIIFTRNTYNGRKRIV